MKHKPRKQPTLKRTKSLLNAALHLWELRNGLRPERYDRRKTT